MKLLGQYGEYVRKLKMLSEALTQYVENSDTEEKPEYLDDAIAFLDSVDKQLFEILGEEKESA